MDLMRIIALGVVLSSGLAVAGEKHDRFVYIDTQNRTAHAGMGSTRNSADFVQYIVCQVIANASGISGSCAARAAAGTYVTCQTTNQYMLEVIKSISDSSFVGFKWDENGGCTEVFVNHGSSYVPKL
ncbi:hypothetical protein [Myxococcus sp. CA040A]|uniref:hypothetical protein n=1 Tax=Myxococcus sp. CA040A TaxID=2741738 RepID=UPI00157B27A1|nr:hypothetical protein [Myxococcus sp. CA040A]NTX01472.1 hypothetical protein [Myxococcus sp. CA040A]